MILKATLMTVLELIHQLQIMPPDALVVAEGYEDGYDSIHKKNGIWDNISTAGILVRCRLCF
jgi:hypothetical protein